MGVTQATILAMIVGTMIICYHIASIAYLMYNIIIYDTII